MSKVWKWLFLGLLALNLALVSVVTYRIMTPVETTSSVSLPKGVETVTFDKLPEAIGYLTEQVIELKKLVAELQPQP